MRVPIKVVKKFWGWEEWLLNEEHANLCAKRLIVRANKACSLHYHPLKNEVFIVEKGCLRVEVDQELLTVSAGDSVHIPAGTPHRFSNRMRRRAQILEISNFHSDDDVVRLEPSRNVPVG
jgi:mannose-6-phosphate isomerase-like protein (cupin superfamily)